MLDQVMRYDELIVDNARLHGLRPSLVAGLIECESGGDPNAPSKAGAVGLMQVIPAEKIAGRPSAEALLDPATNIRAGCAILASAIWWTQTQAGGLAAYFGAVDDEGRPTLATDGSAVTGWRYVELVEKAATPYAALDVYAPPEWRAGGWGKDWVSISTNIKGVADNALGRLREITKLSEGL